MHWLQTSNIYLSTTCEFDAYDDDENLVSINPIF